MSQAEPLKVLSAAEVAAIHDAALSVLAECGVFIDYPRALDHLEANGAKVDKANGRVRFPKALIEKSLAACPSTFALYDREGNEAFKVGGNDVHFATSSCAVRYQEGSVAHSSTAEDLVRLTQVSDALPHLDLVSTQVVAKEAPKTIADTYRLFLVLANSSKPVITGAFSEQGLWDMKSLLDALSGGRTADAPMAIFDACPSPPLKWAAIGASNIMDGAASGLPIEFISMPMPGAATPATLAGSVVIHTAETLSGVVLAQTVRPGTKVVWGGAPVGFDMRYGTTPLSAVEATLIAAAYGQMGKHYHLPTHTYAGLSDSKLVDCQAGLETALSGTLAALARINLIAGAGALDFVGTQSLEKLALDDECCGLILRAVRGIEVTAETTAKDLIAELGPGADYLGQKHTRKWYRAESYVPGTVIDRLDRKGWESQGKTDSLSRAKEKVDGILRERKPRPLEDARAAGLNQAMRKVMAERGAGALPYVAG